MRRAARISPVALILGIDAKCGNLLEWSIAEGRMKRKDKKRPEEVNLPASDQRMKLISLETGFDCKILISVEELSFGPGILKGDQGPAHIINESGTG